MITRYETLHDCVNRLRLRYHLSAPVSRAILERYTDPDEYATEIYDATHLLPKARVLYRIQHRAGHFEIAGAFGLTYATVTYARNPDMEQRRAGQEEIIERLT